MWPSVRYFVRYSSLVPWPSPSFSALAVHSIGYLVLFRNALVSRTLQSSLDAWKTIPTQFRCSCSLDFTLLHRLLFQRWRLYLRTAVPLHNRSKEADHLQRRERGERVERGERGERGRPTPGTEQNTISAWLT